MAEPAAPTVEEQQKASEIANAGAQAAAAGPPEQAGDRAAAAMKTKRDEVGLTKMSDEDIDRLCNAFVNKLDERGAFDPPPEATRAPEPAAPTPPADQSQAAGEPAPAVPQKRSPAAKFFGL